MPKKILVIGCSHSAGAYDEYDTIISNESWVWHLNKIRNKDEQYWVIHNPANGIIHYGAILKYLKNEGLLSQFDSCIVQMTGEMRMMFYDNTSDSYYPLLKEWLQTSNDQFNQRPESECFDPKYRTLSYYGSDVYDTYAEKFKTTDAKSAWMDVSQRILEGIRGTYTIDSMYDVYYKYIVDTLKECGVDPVVFDWWGKVENHTLEKGDEWILDSVMQTAQSRGMWNTEWMTPVGQHHNSKSARLMAEIINEAIDKNGKLQ